MRGRRLPHIVGIMNIDTKQRLSDLRIRMGEAGVDLVAVGPGSHMQWLVGFHPHPDERPCLLLVGLEKEIFLMPVLNAEGSRENTDIEFHTWRDTDGPDAAVASCLSVIGATKAAVVVIDETMRVDFGLLLLNALPGVRHRFTGDTLGKLRMRKQDREFRLLKMNAGIADFVLQKAFAAIRPGMTESDLASEIRAHFAAQGAETEFTIVGAGPNGAFPHHQSGQRKFLAGDSVVIDIGARKNGFPSDITRMAVVGFPPEGYLEIHAVVEQALTAALIAAQPGAKALDVDRAARSVISEFGYGEFFVHRTGHGLGIDGHEPPYLTATSQTTLEPGMVFSIEPGIYIPGRFGVRLEEIVILRANGPEILSNITRDLYVAEV